MSSNPFAPLNGAAPSKGKAGPQADLHSVMPVPKDAPSPLDRHPSHGRPVHRWPYLDERSELLGYACRFVRADGTKTYQPLTLFRDVATGALKWKWKGWGEPRPLYGLDRLAARPEAPVLLCEGEKAADAAAELVAAYVAVTSPNGGKSAGKADWSPLRGRHVVIWPDADPAGLEYASAATPLILAAGAASVSQINPPSGASVGWDAADALAEGWSQERARSLVAGAVPLARPASRPDTSSTSAAPPVQGRVLRAVEGAIEDEEADLPAVARLRPEVLWPFGYEMTAAGLLYRVKADGPGENLSGPFRVHAMVRTEDGLGWSLAISFRDLDRRLHVVMVSRADLASGDTSELRRELAGKGLELTSGRGARERFAAALAGVAVETRALLVGKAGWHAAGTVYAAPSFTAAAGQREREPIIFRGDPGASLFREKGDLRTWREQVASLAVGQTRLLFALGIAFAGPLLDPLGLEPGCFNLVGASSTGKTSALRLAGSVWGGGGPIGFSTTWRTTSNALEGVCAQHNDSFLGLDELGMCPPNEVDAAAYSLTGGSGKSRLKSDGELRARQRWRVMVLSTAEITLGQRIAEGGFGKSVKAGQAVRFVDLPADAGCGFGLFDSVGAFAEAAKLADAIRDRTEACYGFAGAAFVRAYLERPAQSLTAARAVIADFVARQVEEGASGQVHRVALRFGLVAAAGELATRFGLLPVEPGAVTAAAGVLFRQWVEQRGGIGASEARTAVTQVRDFLQRHALARFVPAGPGLDSGSWRAQQVAGFRMGDEDGGDFLFTDGGFAEATSGLDPRAAADALAEAKFLIKDAEGRRKAVVRVGGKPTRLYRVAHAILEGEEA